ncbi:hypothetical protein AGDE_03257 [Angomonas deanei]|uniref:Uncharacterized protein n=1 Tax=Angomonas deanei TaxID=59799 RepID=S9VET9_9TRYP|nr:hypothetical protein AGDE_04550 [Angomonas deanei]EPY40670.1 hypothetical protein AGDE_03257 [Angomonas deanei]CAD2222496.1 hypothetical protein, conserved [Angomonas deanei]|eukprot:EPY39378.1 hypothetical protein AGDE_04550 [Angomonas deanei]
MPRAYYKPFTVYEEVVGFHNAKRNAYIFCGLFFGGILFKCLLMSKYSSVVNPDLNDGLALEDDPRYRAAMQERAELVYTTGSRDAMQKAIRKRRLEPPPA